MNVNQRKLELALRSREHAIKRAEETEDDDTRRFWLRRILAWDARVAQLRRAIEDEAT